MLIGISSTKAALMKWFLCVVILVSPAMFGCDGGSGTAPPALAGCGPFTAKVTGQFTGVAPTSVNTTATVADSGTSITWTVPAGATGRAIDNNPATGTIPAPVGGSPGTAPAPRSFTAKGTSGEFDLEVDGSVTGPPQPCKANGNWRLKIKGTNTVVGSGRWVFP